MTHHERIMYGVEVAQKERVSIGSPCAHPSDKMVYNLVAYEDDDQMAVLSLYQVAKRFPACEVFNPNTALKVAKGTLISNN